MASFWKAFGSNPYASLKVPESNQSSGPSSGTGSPKAPHGHAHESSNLSQIKTRRDDTPETSSPTGAPPAYLAAALSKIVPGAASAPGYTSLRAPEWHPGESEEPTSPGALGPTDEATKATPKFVRPQPSRPSVDPTDPSDYLEHFLASSSSRDGAFSSSAEHALDPKFFMESFDSVSHTLELLEEEEQGGRVSLDVLGGQFRVRVQQLDAITEQLATQVMSHHTEMVEGMQLHGEMEKDLQTLSIIAKNARRHLARAMEEVSNDLVVAASVQRKRMLTAMIPLLLKIQQISDMKRRLEDVAHRKDFAKALQMCSECLVAIEANSSFSAVADMNRNIESWLARTVEAVDDMLLAACRNFQPSNYSKVVDAYAVMDDAPTLAEKAQNFFSQCVVTETYNTLIHFLEQAQGKDDGRRGRLSYNELCLQLPESIFRMCLRSTLGIIFEILCAHHRMMNWEHPMAERPADVVPRGIEPTPDPTVGDLEHLNKGPATTATGPDRQYAMEQAGLKNADLPEPGLLGDVPGVGVVGVALVRTGSGRVEEGQGAGVRLAREQRMRDLTRGSSDKERSRQSQGLDGRPRESPQGIQNPSQGGSYGENQGGEIQDDSQPGQTQGNGVGPIQNEARDGSQGRRQSSGHQNQSSQQEGRKRETPGGEGLNEDEGVSEVCRQGQNSSGTESGSQHLSSSNSAGALWEQAQHQSHSTPTAGARNLNVVVQDNPQQSQGNGRDVKVFGMSATSSGTSTVTGQCWTVLREEASKEGQGTEQGSLGTITGTGQEAVEGGQGTEQTQTKLAATGKAASEPNNKELLSLATATGTTFLSSTNLQDPEGVEQKGPVGVTESRVWGFATGLMSPRQPGGTPQWQDTRLGDFPPKVALRMRRDTTAAVRRALEKGRKAVWELASRRVSSLISSDALCAGSSQQFLQSLEWVDQFILLGESFTQSEAVGLRAKVAKQSEKYFKVFHCQNLEVLRMIIERESWQRLPPSALSTLTLSALIGAPSNSLASPPMPILVALSKPPTLALSPPMAAALTPYGTPAASPLGTPGASPSVGPSEATMGCASPSTAVAFVPLSSTQSNEVRCGFGEWVEKGNPFAEPGEGETGGGAGDKGTVAARWKASLVPKANTVAVPPRLGAIPGSALLLNGAPGMERGLGAAPPCSEGPPEGVPGDAGPGMANGVGLGQMQFLRLRQQQQQQQQQQGDEDSEEEELMADYIDDEGRTGKATGRVVPRARSKGTRNLRGRRGRGTSGVGRRRLGEGKLGLPALGLGLALTGASLSLIRLMDRYARLMQILKPIASDIFQGLCQLFELYLLSIFRLFGHKDAMVSFRIGLSLSDTLFTPEASVKLRSTLARISQSLEQQQQQAQQHQALGKSKTSTSGSTSSTSSSPAPPSPSPSASPLTQSSLGLGDALGSFVNGMDLSALGSLPFPAPPSPSATLLAENNMYGLKERCVAMESLIWIADLLQESRTRMQQLLQPTAVPILDSFFTKTLDAVPDLWEHVLKTLTRKLLSSVINYPDRIAGLQWEIKQPQRGTPHNQYVESLLSEFQLLIHKLTVSGTQAQVQEELMEYAMELVSQVVLEGFARVKRCTNEGRARMSMDVQVLSAGLEQLTGMEPELLIVENYIKAFYLPETEFLHWARTHPEYSKSQVIGLVNLVATMNNWKRKARLEVIESIEAGDSLP